jgi:hypothetical protein
LWKNAHICVAARFASNKAARIRPQRQRTYLFIFYATPKATNKGLTANNVHLRAQGFRHVSVRRGSRHSRPCIPRDVRAKQVFRCGVRADNSAPRACAQYGTAYIRWIRARGLQRDPATAICTHASYMAIADTESGHTINSHLARAGRSTDTAILRLPPRGVRYEPGHRIQRSGNMRSEEHEEVKSH